MSKRSKKNARQEKAAAVRSSPPALPVGERPGMEGSCWLKSESPAAGLNDRRLVPGVCIFLAAVVWVVFGQTLGHEFVNYDDNMYVYENPAVTRGLNLKGVEWALTHVVCANWHPLTMMSHMLDCRLYGLNAGGHHLTNVLLHTASVILLFLVLRQMTGFLWRSAFVAAVFAIHPLRVESVAWVAERKDVLSGLFFMLTLWAYTRYVASDQPSLRFGMAGKWQVTRTDPASSRVPRHPSLFYCLVLLFFALGLMCKPMLVTLPLVLLLLDYWPLRRVVGGGWQVTGPDSHVTHHASRITPQIGHILLEKLPLIGLAVASCVVTIFAQHEALQSFEHISLSLRVGNAPISCVAYLGQMFWPAGLAVLYPFTARGVGVSGVMLALVLLAAISTGVFVLRRRCPCILTGWLWYLIMLAPVIGILQVGWQARADRYTYLPQIGLYLLLTWAAADLCAGWRHRRLVLGGLAAVILAALIFCARAQVVYWRNSETLWTHTLACTSGNDVAHNNLGIILAQKGLADEAIAQFRKALEVRPDNAEAQNNLGRALLQNGNADEAITHFQKALQINPGYAGAHNNLGNALLPKDRVDEAIIQYQTALQIKPDFAEAHNNLGNALLKVGRVDEAIAHFQEALQINPVYSQALSNLAWALATSPQALLRNGNKAVVLAQQANQLTGGESPLILHVLAAAYAEVGRFSDARQSAQKAIELAQAAGQQDLAGQISNELKLYEKGLPFHQESE